MSLFSSFKNYFFLFLFVLPTGNCLLAQGNNSIGFLNWTKENGLPSNNTIAVEKDNLGFLWVATNDGLCRFDGPNLIKVYREPNEENAEANSLKSNNIRTLFSDSQGFLWIGTRFGGLTRFHPSKNTWKTFRHDPAQENSLSNDEVLTIFEDSKKRIWVGTEKGLNLFDPSTSTFKHYDLYDSYNKDNTDKPVLTVLEDQRGWIWVGTWAGGLYLLLSDEEGQINEKQTRHFRSTSDESNSNVWSLFQDNGGRFWVGTHGGGLFLMNFPEEASNKIGDQNWTPTFINYNTKSKEANNLKSNDIQMILQDRFDDLWLGTSHGLYRIYSKNLPPLNAPQTVSLAFESFLSFSEEPTSLCGNNVMDLLEDEQGLIWIATADGLSQYNRSSNLFKNFDFPISSYRVPFSPNFVLDKEQNIWVGTREKGIISFSFDKHQLVQTQKDINPLILGKEVGTIYSPAGESLYVGTELGITVIDLKSLQTIKYPSPPWVRSYIQKLNATNILVDKDGFIWLGTKSGLFRIDSKTKEYSLFKPEKNNPNSISDHPVNQIIQDSKGAIWVATYKGLNRIANPTEKELVFEKFFYDDTDPSKGPLTNEIMSLKEVGDYLYVGTISGMSRFNFSTKLFESFDLERHKYWVRSMEEGNDGNLWVSTNEGILNFDVQKKAFRFFDKKDGLKTPRFQLGCSFKDPNGKIYFTYANGFTCFNPSDLAANETAPPVYITGIERMTTKGMFFHDGVQNEEIILHHNEYRISVEFAALNYNRADKNQYAYRLLGFEDQWNIGKSGIPIVYTSLEPKEYQLEVKAANNDGIWNEKGAVLKIIQKPPFWKTWWFLLSAFCLSITSLFSITSWYTNNIRKHNEKLQDYNKILNKEIANRKRAEQKLNDYNSELKRSNKDLEQFAYIASHDLKEPLRVIGNFSGLLSRRYGKDLDDNALEYIDFIQDGVKRMSKLVSSLLTFSTVGRTDIVYDSVELTFLVSNKAYDLSQLILENNAIIKIGELPRINAQREQIGMVFFNLMQNAIKYNTSKEPYITVQQETGDEQFWKFSVTDNGIGIPQQYQERIFEIFKRLHGKGEYEGTGIGLSVCQKIILRHQGNIWFESEVDKGTTFYFTIKKDLSVKAAVVEKELLEVSQN